MSNYLRCVPSPPTCTRRLQQVQHRSCCLLCLSQPGLMRVVSSRMFTSELCWRISACDSSATLVSLTPQPVSPRPSLHSLSSPWSHLLSVLCCCCSACAHRKEHSVVDTTDQSVGARWWPLLATALQRSHLSLSSFFFNSFYCKSLLFLSRFLLFTGLHRGCC